MDIVPNFNARPPVAQSFVLTTMANYNQRGWNSAPSQPMNYPLNRPALDSTSNALANRQPNNYQRQQNRRKYRRQKSKINKQRRRLNELRNQIRTHLQGTQPIAQNANGEYLCLDFEQRSVSPSANDSVISQLNSIPTNCDAEPNEQRPSSQNAVYFSERQLNKYMERGLICMKDGCFFLKDFDFATD